MAIHIGRARSPRHDRQLERSSIQVNLLVTGLSPVIPRPPPHRRRHRSHHSRCFRRRLRHPCCSCRCSLLSSCRLWRPAASSGRGRRSCRSHHSCCCSLLSPRHLWHLAANSPFPTLSAARLPPLCSSPPLCHHWQCASGVPVIPVIPVVPVFKFVVSLLSFPSFLRLSCCMFLCHRFLSLAHLSSSSSSVTLVLQKTPQAVLQCLAMVPLSAMVESKKMSTSMSPKGITASPTS
jgi:hypothetical protein